MLGINLRKNGNNGSNEEPGNGNGHYRNGNKHLIELHGVVKTFETAAGPFTALKGIDLRVGTGEFVSVVGKSGSGKSTLINMITGIDRPSSGHVLVGDTAVETLSEGQLAAWRGRNVGVIFQFFQLLPTLTVLENVMLPMDFCHMYAPQERPERAMQLLAQVDVADQADKLPGSLSGGQQQRVAIARALANDPSIIVADEPTGNLDSKTADSVFRLFEGLVTSGKTILMVTHDRDLAKRATRTVVLSDGEIIEERLAHVFPALNTAQLVRATHGLEPEWHQPGAIILREGDSPDRLHIVTGGHVDVVVRGAGGEERVAATLGPGQYFGEVELLRGGTNIASIRAGLSGGAHLAALERDAFMGVLTESAPTREEITRLVQARVAENAASRRRNGHA
jgi:ABC-type lipoprotein export system ATPase subunit